MSTQNVYTECLHRMSPQNVYTECIHRESTQNIYSELALSCSSVGIRLNPSCIKPISLSSRLCMFLLEMFRRFVQPVTMTYSRDMVNRPCVDCGRRTGCFCDHCYAAVRDPYALWLPDQPTPLCTDCDREHAACHFCRGLQWVVPPPFG
jgi:hypothetical protein